jgi:hypothetical protein
VLSSALRRCIPFRWSAHADDDLAAGASLADVGQCLGYLVEGEGSIDMDGEGTRYAEIGYRLEVGRALPDGEHAEPAVREPAGDRTDRQYA